MARSAILSNGRLCVGLDERGFVNDFYYPYVGLDNMTSARFVHHKIGIWVDGEFSWLDSDEWQVSAGLDENSMMSRVHYSNERLGLSLSLRDFVDVSYDFFGRTVIVENRSDQERNIRLFFGQVFQISDAGRVDTAIYTKAANPYILTYHGKLFFVAGLRNQDGDSFDQFAVGNYGIEGKAGTYRDAEDGELSGNLVEHGGVDSIIRTSFNISPKHSYHVDYWIAASDKSYHDASHIHRALSVNGLFHYLNATTIHWKKWLSTSQDFINTLDVKYQALAKKSLLTIKAHCDERGGIIASADSSIYNYGRDYYNYVWPRDAGYALTPLLRAGYTDEVKKYLDFAMRVISPRGYLHHKFLPDYSVGSTWHPLVQDGKAELNIQEDELASTVILAIEYLRHTKDMSAVKEKLLRKLIVPGTAFLAEFIDQETGLPHASYDLWEQVFLTSTYTIGVVYKALSMACDYVNSEGFDVNTEQWQNTRQSIEQNYNKLFDEKNQWFVRGLRSKDHNFEQDSTLDISSLYSMVMYGPAKPEDASVFATYKAVETYLSNTGGSGGFIRYPHDGYMLTDQGQNGNPWYVCTLWLGQCYAAAGRNEDAYKTLEWALSHASSSGMLSEQLDPVSGDMRGVAPLVWSHAEYISLLQKLNGYL